jgi:YebC/PmpR family DNA-binding regulatory protein
MGAQWKHKGKEESAAAKGKLFTKLAKELMVAARSSPDPSGNPRLRMAIDAARKASMTKDTIERAVKKGAGLLDEPVNYETIVYEGFAPYQVGVIVECLTENRNRTSANVRQLFKKGQIGALGSVTWDFMRLGQVEATSTTKEDPEEAAIECGAQEVEPAEEGASRFYTDPGDVDTVSKALTARKWDVHSAQLIWKAKNPVTSLDDAQRAEVEAFLLAIDDDDDVQTLYAAL